eukprot:c24576_g1_i1 orf=90-1334(+)
MGRRRRRSRRIGKTSGLLPYGDCRGWRGAKGTWDNSRANWEFMNLPDLIGHELYDKIMEWNDSGSFEALEAAQMRERATKQRQPRWLPKLKVDLYVDKVDWELPASIEACDMPLSAAEAYEEEETLKGSENTEFARWRMELTPGNNDFQLAGEWPIKPSGWGSLDSDEPQPQWKSGGWHPEEPQNRQEFESLHFEEKSRNISGCLESGFQNCGWQIKASGWESLDNDDIQPEWKATQSIAEEPGQEYRGCQFEEEPEVLKERVEAGMENSSKVCIAVSSDWPIVPSGWGSLDDEKPEPQKNSGGFNDEEPQPGQEFGTWHFETQGRILTGCVEVELASSEHGHFLVANGWPIRPTGWGSSDDEEFHKSGQWDGEEPQTLWKSGGWHFEAGAKIGWSDLCNYRGHCHNNLLMQNL